MWENVMYCPKCSRKIDAFTSLTGDSAPEEDDFTLCIYCDTILQFNADLSTRIPEQIPDEIFKAYEPYLRWKKARLN